MDIQINQEARDALNRLAELPGMGSVKQQVEQMIQLARITKLRQGHRLKTQAQSLHMLFAGNPGTGKTTAARLIGEAFAAIGVLKRSGSDVPFVEVHHSKIVHAEVGRTEQTLLSKFRGAKGGVLFIDEAYSLIGKAHHRHDEKVVAALVQCMEDMRNDVVVIAAGYPGEMEDFLNFNPGLRSRFSTTIHFPDYSVPDLIAISRQMLKEQEYEAAPDYLEALTSVLWVEKAKPHFGNARTVRNHLERSIRHHALRVSKLPQPSRHDLTTLRGCDLVHDVVALKGLEKEALMKIIKQAQARLLNIELREIIQGR